MLFNITFTPAAARIAPAAHLAEGINHARPAFIQNKRCRPNPRRFAAMVNPAAVSVYQTDPLLILIERAAAPPARRFGKRSF
jgi:hypothetical protein